jgi:hypothetical protein
VPNSTAATAIFGSTGTTNISFPNVTSDTVFAIQFNAGAQAYTFNVVPSGTSVDFTLSLVGAGIVNNNATTTPTFAVGSNGNLIFTNGASAGNATISSLAPGGLVQFLGHSTASAATIIDVGTSFGESATAGNATISVNASAPLAFSGNSDAGNANITMTSGAIDFFNASAANAHITITGASSDLDFRGTATAGNATITASTGFVNFGLDLGPSVAGTSTITIGPAGTLEFDGSSSGDHAAIAINGGNLKLSGSAGLGNAVVQVAAGSTVSRPMKLASQTMRSGGSGISARVRWRALVRSSTWTRGSSRSFQASCAWPTSTA